MEVKKKKPFNFKGLFSANWWRRRESNKPFRFQLSNIPNRMSRLSFPDSTWIVILCRKRPLSVVEKGARLQKASVMGLDIRRIAGLTVTGRCGIRTKISRVLCLSNPSNSWRAGTWLRMTWESLLTEKKRLSLKFVSCKMQSSKSLALGFHMKCHRCGGIMTHEKFYCLHDHFWGWRCVACGEIIDQEILANRLSPEGK